MLHDDTNLSASGELANDIEVIRQNIELEIVIRSWLVDME
jgi:hypothetical protein